MKLLKIAALLLCISVNAQNDYNLLVGTYTNKCESDGIYVYGYDASSGELKLKGSTKNVDNPSFLTVSADEKTVYAVNESGKKSSVSAFQYMPAEGKLDLIDKKNAKGEDPCHIISDEKNVIIANYTSGNIVVFGRNKKGELTDAKQVVIHSGNSMHPRQKSSHVHMVQFSPDKKYVLATDLGTDEIYIYDYDPDGGKETLVEQDVKDVKKGSGPRHLVFNPNNTFLYTLHELDGTLSAYYYKDGNMANVQDLTVQPEGMHTEDNSAAEIQITKDGKYIYATNRGGANNISVFKVHANGKINLIQQISTEGIAPRHFTIDPNEQFILVANQISNNIVIFKRDKATGMLEDTGNRVEVCQPVCLVFTKSK
ncbi:3-carboxymuconate cyclase [Flavobacterium suaedae]|uniref:3-carboxymuconate cyclase n=1 Tax=Flavobacterium suaedae TaxID=1767027 RepID=A0ABQ1JF62_9FLAO|nr:lactonase family protein [Flavobacterium suaedae]GGB67376.1 3-carboxymuconate cyclase [Flavobacterium suaedae]